MKLAMVANDKEHEKRNEHVTEWLRYNYSSALIEYKLGLIDVFEYVRHGAYD